MPPIIEQHHCVNNNSNLRLNSCQLKRTVRTEEFDTLCPKCSLYFKGQHGLNIHIGHKHKCKLCRTVLDDKDCCRYHN